MYKKNARRMKLKHAKTYEVREFTVGEFVSLRIPRIDRASTDVHRLPCVVVEVVGKAQGMYRLRSKFGVLKVCYHAGDLEGYSGTYKIPVAGWEEAQRVSLREAAKLSSPWNIFKTSLKLVADFMQTKEKAITFEFVGVQMQDGASDCGLFAIAFTTSICNDHDPTTLQYNQSAMRSHFLKCIEQGQITPFPSVPRRKPSKTIENVVIPVYCICRLIDNGTKMIQCAGCNEWFHVACVQVEKKFITCQKLDWFCPNCTRN